MVTGGSRTAPVEHLTTDFADALLEVWRSELPQHIRAYAERTLLNTVAVAVGGSRDRAVDLLLETAREIGGVGTTSVPGRHERTDLYYAAIATGLAAHVDDFDDTHFATIVHPGSVALAATLGFAQLRRTAGADVLKAFALGCEAHIRLAAVMSPRHFDAGWQLTGTCGAVAAAVGVGMLSGLSGPRLADAIGIAASQSLGVREAHGTMIKAAHPGKAAANGLLAVLLAEDGFSAAPDALGAPCGFLDVLSDESEPRRLLAGFGERWELLDNVFKPYPSGFVTHPIIDAGLAVAPRVRALSEVAQIEIRCHPLVLELTGRLQPDTGLSARFSAAHCVAVALLDREVGVAQFTDERAADPEVAALRGAVRLTVDPALDSDEAILLVQLEGGRSVREHVRHALGSVHRPLSDEQLLAKVRDLVDLVIPGATDRIVAAVRGLSKAPDVDDLVAALTPQARGS